MDKEAMIGQDKVVTNYGSYRKSFELSLVLNLL